MTNKEQTSKIGDLIEGFGNAVRVSRVRPDDTRCDNIIALAICFVTAFVCLAICSQSSFLYPINSWVDANCFFTVGRAMMNGKVVYRDIYEQKGILLYFLHGLCSLISSDSFIGVFFMEVAAATAFLFFSYKTMRLWCGKLCLFAIPIAAALIYPSMNFVNGDSAEELCMPFLAFGIWYSCTALRNRKPPSFWGSMLIGMTSGAVLWIKYTMLGLYIGGVIVPLILMLRAKKFKELLVFASGVICGVAAITLPFFIYFAANGALSDWFGAYFYNNIFLYTGQGQSSPIASFFSATRTAYYNYLINPSQAVPIALGLSYMMLTMYHRTAEKLHIILTCFFLSVMIYFGGNAYFYYFFVVSVFTPIGAVPIVRLIEIVLAAGRLPARKKHFDICAKLSTVALSALLCVLAGVHCYRTSGNVYFMDVSRDDLPQYRFAEIIGEKEGATMLSYGWLDGGFYTVAGIIPDCKYFCLLNMMGLPEMSEVQNEWVDEARADFVVTIGMELGSDNYETVDSCDWVNFFGDTETYFLARRIENERIK